MIGYLEGRVIEEGLEWVVVLAGQVGYQVFLPLSAMPSIMAGEEEVRLFISTQVADEIPKLFGFRSREERELFEALITVSGVGPKAAMKILCLPGDVLVNAIAGEDTRTICTVKGIGKKIAERVILELKDKVGQLGMAAHVQSAPGYGARQRAETRDAVEGLKSLGFNVREVNEVISRLDPDLVSKASTGEIIEGALAVLGRGKAAE